MLQQLKSYLWCRLLCFNDLWLTVFKSGSAKSIKLFVIIIIIRGVICWERVIFVNLCDLLMIRLANVSLSTVNKQLCLCLNSLQGCGLDDTDVIQLSSALVTLKGLKLVEWVLKSTETIVYTLSDRNMYSHVLTTARSNQSFKNYIDPFRNIN